VILKNKIIIWHPSAEPEEWILKYMSGHTINAFGLFGGIEN
jgi:hypothetical protein